MKLPIVLFFLFSSLSIKAQIIISNLSLIDTTQNIFYLGAGIENKIHVTGKGYDPINGKFSISGGGCSFKNLGKGNYIFKCEMETDDCILWYHEKGQLVFKQKFICRKINLDARARYGGLKDSTATASQLFTNPFIYADIPDSYYKHNINITSFNATFISPELDSLKTYSAGNLLTNEQKELIKKLNPGDKIFFDQIYALGPDSRRRKLPPFTIIIK